MLEAATFDLRTGVGRAAGPARLHHQEDRMPLRAGRHAAPAVDEISRPHHRRQRRAAGLPAALHGLLLHRLHQRACLRLRLWHRRQRQVDLHQHHRRHIRRLRDRCRHVDTSSPATIEHHPTDLAKLRGARLVVAQETQKGRRWDETKIKALTGGDKITARFMRQDFFDFVPTLQAVHLRQPQAAPEQRRRGHAPPAAAGAVHRADSAGRARPASWPRSSRPSGRRSCAGASTAAWNGSASAWRRPPSCSTPRESYFAEQDTMRQWLEDCTQDGGPLAFSPEQRPVRSVEDLVRGQQPVPGDHAGLIGSAQRPWLCQEAGQYRAAGVLRADGNQSLI